VTDDDINQVSDTARVRHRLSGALGARPAEARQPTAQLALCVVHVCDVLASVEFYAQVLDLAISLRTRDAAMLIADNGCQLVLLETPHASQTHAGAAGIQYVVWAASDHVDLNNIEFKLKCLDARVSRQAIDGITYVEGRDPSGIPIIVTYPPPHSTPPAHIFNRVYGRRPQSDRAMTTPAEAGPSCATGARRGAS
jgi:hypothetical protein